MRRSESRGEDKVQWHKLIVYWLGKMESDADPMGQNFG